MVVHDAVVLAGGTGRRMGGVLKPQVTVRGRRLLDHVLDATAGAGSVVVVAPEAVPVPGGVVRTLEDPPHGGPVAGIAAGLRALGGHAPLVLLLACDLPNAAAAVPRLLAASARIAGSPPAAENSLVTDSSLVTESSLVDDGDKSAGDASAVEKKSALGDDVVEGDESARGGDGASGDRSAVVGTGVAAVDGVVLRDAGGRDQWLLGIYSARALQARVAELEAAGDVRGTSVRELVAPLRLASLAARPGEAQDVDTWADRDAISP